MKKFIFIGDSITVGTYTENGDTVPQSIAHPNYAQSVSSHFGAECLNFAKNGIAFSSLSPVNSADCICNGIDKVSDGDCLFVVGGAPVTQAFADEIGADIYTSDAASAAEAAKAVLIGA